MTIIAVRVPPVYTLKAATKAFIKAVQGHYEALKFVRATKEWKLLYLRIAPKLNANLVVQRINSTRISAKHGNFKAHIPDSLPDLTPVGKKRHIVPEKLRRKYNIPTETNTYQVVRSTQAELLTELQSKFTGLYNLSRKLQHRLLDSIAQIILERLEAIASSDHVDSTALDSPPNLGRAYRRAHPHFGDFQLILGTLHKVEDEAGKPRTQLLEEELMKMCNPARVIASKFENSEAMKAASVKYSRIITNKLKEHFDSLDATPAEGDTEEETHRRQVRAELKRIAPYVPEIVRGLLQKALVPTFSYQRVSIFGEPNLPPKQQMDPWLKPYRPLKAYRKERAYNCLMTNIPDDTFPALVARDGDTVGPSKLIIRMTDHPLYVPFEEHTQMDL